MSDAKEPDHDEDFEAWFIRHLAKRTLATLEGPLADSDYKHRLTFITMMLGIARTAGESPYDDSDDILGGSS